MAEREERGLKMEVVFLGALVFGICFNQLEHVKIETKDYIYYKTQWWGQEQNSSVYCHKESGECFFQEFTCHKKEEGCFVNELEPSNFYPGLSEEELQTGNYELLTLNAYPVFYLKNDLKIDPREKEPPLQSLIAGAIENSGYKFFRQIQTYSDGAKKIEFTGYGRDQSWILIKHGIFHRWYQNGQKQLEADFRYGKLWGKSTIWYENGFKKQEANYIANKLHGVAKYYYEDGALMYEDTYEHGERKHRTTFNHDVMKSNSSNPDR